MTRFLHVGGVVAVGFDPTSSYLLVVSHSGRGVFSTSSWERVARDYIAAYPVEGIVTGIGPISEQRIAVTEIGSGCQIHLTSPNRSMELLCESSVIEVLNLDAPSVS